MYAEDPGRGLRWLFLIPAGLGVLSAVFFLLWAYALTSANGVCTGGPIGPVSSGSCPSSYTNPVYFDVGLALLLLAVAGTAIVLSARAEQRKSRRLGEGTP